VCGGGWGDACGLGVAACIIWMGCELCVHACISHARVFLQRKSLVNADILRCLNHTNTQTIPVRSASRTQQLLLLPLPLVSSFFLDAVRIQVRSHRSSKAFHSPLAKLSRRISATRRKYASPFPTLHSPSHCPFSLRILLKCVTCDV